MKKQILLLAILCMLVIIPASAYTTTYTAPADQAVWGIDFDAPYGSTGDITFNLEDGSTVSGSWSYVGALPIVADMELEGETSTYYYMIPIPTSLKIGVWNGDNQTDIRVINLGYGQTKAWNDVLWVPINRSPTVSYTIVSSQQISVVNELRDRSDVYGQLARFTGGSIIDLLWEQATTLFSIFLGAAHWLKFLFVDHIALTISLYFSGTMAYAMLSSRNIFIFYKTWFRQQRAMFEFIVTMAESTVSIASQIGGIAVAAASNVLGKIAAFFGL